MKTINDEWVEQCARLLERQVQARFVAKARRGGWHAYKFSSPSNRSVPDYIFLKNGILFFVEFKAEGKKPTASQAEKHTQLRNAGFFVAVCDHPNQYAQIVGQAVDEYWARRPVG